MIQKTHLRFSMLFAILAMLLSLSVFANVPLEKMLVVPVPQSDYTVTVAVNKGEGSVYSPGEKVQMTITPNRDSYIVVWDMTPNGNVHIIFPNQYDQNNFVKAGQTLRLPGTGYAFEIEPGAGVEWVQVFASTEQFAQFNSWAGQFQSDIFPTLPLAAVMSLKSDIVTKMAVKPEPAKPAAGFASAFTHFYVGMAPRTGWATFVTSPAGAAVMVDGRILSGKTPLERITLNEGVHYVRFVKEGYLPLELSFVVNANEHRYHTSALTPSILPATLIVNPNPAQATILVNDTVVGMGRATLDGLRAVVYTVEARLEGYETYREEVLLNSGETKQKDITLKRLMGKLTLSVDPLNAKVTVGGTVYTPTNGLVEVEKAPGDYALSVEAAGYAKEERILRLTQGPNPPIAIRLTPMKAKLTILSDPSEATVKINGFDRGKTPLILELDAGNYLLSLEKEYFTRQAENIVLRPGEEKTLTLTMRSTVGYLNVPGPEGISIYINDTFRGWAPNTLPLEEGVYVLSLKDKGKERFRQTITIVAGNTTVITY